MIDYLMLQGLKPLSQETEVEDPNKDMEVLEAWKRLTHVSDYIQQFNTIQPPFKEPESTPKPQIEIEQLKTQEPRPGSYFTDSHLKSEEDERKKEIDEYNSTAKQDFLMAHPDAIEADFQFDYNGVFDIEKSELSYITRSEDTKKTQQKEAGTRMGANIAKTTKATNFNLSYAAIASYYNGVDATGASSEQLNEYFKGDFAALSKEEQNRKLKEEIILDILQHSTSSEIKKFAKEYINAGEPLVIGNRQIEVKPALKKDIPEETLDLIYDKWLHIEGKQRLTRNEGKSDNDVTAELLGTQKPKSEINWTQKHLDKAETDREMPFANDGTLYSRRLPTNARLSADKSQADGQVRLQEYAANTKKQHDQYVDSLTPEEKKRLIDEFKSISKQAVPYYYGEFEGTDKLPISDEEYLELAKEFYSTVAAFGESTAIQNLSNKYQTIVADNTSWVENTCSAVKQGSVNACITATGWLVSPVTRAILYTTSGMSWEAAGRAVDESLHVAQTMGTILPWQSREAHARYNAGLPGYQQRHYKPDEYSIGQSVGDLIESSGYMLGFVGGGAAMGKIIGGASKLLNMGLNAAVRGTASEAQAAAFVAKISEWGAKSQKVAGQLGMAAANANLEAAGTSMDFRHNYKVQLDAEFKNQYAQDLAEDIKSNPVKWAQYYEQKTGVNLIQLGDVNKEINTATNTVSEDAQKIIYDYFSEDIETLNNYKINDPTYQSRLNDINKAADAGYNTTFALNFFPEIILNTTLRSVLLPKSMTRTFTGTPKMDRAIEIMRQGGKWTARGKKAAMKTIAGEYMKNIAGETLDEALESVWGAAGTGVAEAALDESTQSRHGMYSNVGAYGYDLANVIASGAQAGVESIFTQETLVSGIYGGISAAIGIPTLKQFDWSKRKEGESAGKYLQRINPLAWDSILTLPFGINERVKQEQKTRDNIAEFVDAFLQDPAKQRMFENSTYSVNLLNKLSVAQQTGDPNLIADAEAELAASSLSMLAALKGTDYYAITAAEIEARANFSKQNLADPNSAESKAVQDYMSDQRIKGPISHEAVLEGIIKSAKQAKAILQKAEQEMKHAYEIFGDDADIEFIQDVVVNKLLTSDKQQRFDAVDKRIEEFHDKNFVEDPSKSSKISAEGKKRAAKYGTSYRKIDGEKIYAAEDYLAALRHEAALRIEQIKASEDLSKGEKLAKIREINKLIEKEATEVAAYVEEMEVLGSHETVLTAEEILNLDVESQRLFLSREDHSKKQKAEIKRLGSLANDMITRGNLFKDINKHNAVSAQLALNPEYMMDYRAKSKIKAKKEIFKIKYSFLNREGISYEQFRKEYYDAALATESQEDALLLEQTVADNPYFAQLKQESEVARLAIGEILSTEEYGKISKDPRKKANLDALLTYCATNGIPLDPYANIDVLLQQLSEIDPQELQKALDRIETSKENKVLMSLEELAQMLKSTYNGVQTVREAVKKRNAEPEETDATEANNADRTPVVEEEGKDDSNSPSSPAASTKTSESKGEEETTSEKKPIETEGEKKEEETKPALTSPTKASKEELIQTMREVQADDDISAVADDDDIEQAFNWAGSTLVEYNPEKHEQKSAWDYLIDKSKMLPAKTQAILQSIFASMESKTTGAPVDETYPQTMAIEGHTGRRGEYMRKHKSYATLADNPNVKEGAAVRFYTPKELSDVDGELPVVALIESEDGSVKLEGKRYAPIGFVSPTASMKSQNPTRSKNGDVIYSERATIQDVKKEGFAQEHHSKTSDVPVKDALKSDGKTGKQAQADFLGKAKVGKNNKGKTVLQYPVTRGTGKLTVDVDITPASPQRVKNQDGKTVFDSAKSFREASQSTDRQTVIDRAQEVIEHNEYTKAAARALDGLNAGRVEDRRLGVTTDLLKDPTADVSAKLKKIWNGINKFIRLADYDSYTLQAENVTIDEEGNLSFDLTLKQPTAGSASIHLASISGINSRQSISTIDIATALTNLMLNQAGEARSLSGGTSAFVYPVNYTDKEGKLNTVSVGRAFRNGVLVSNKPSFSWPATQLLFKYEHERHSDGAMKAEGMSKMTDNASSATTSENTVTTTDGKKVDIDTGISQETKSEPTPEIVEKAVEEQLMPEEIIEAVVEETGPVEDPFADADDEDYSTFDDNDYEEDDYQLVASRQSRIAKVKEFFKSLIHDLEGKEIFDQVVEGTTARLEKYTKPGAFKTEKVSDRAKAKKEAEKQAEKIRAQKLPHIKSVKVVQNGDRGYSLQIKYNSYKRYLDLKAASAETMIDATLKATIEAFSSKEKVLNPTPEEAKKQLSIFQRFNAKSLREKFNSLLSTPVSQRFEKLLSEVLSLHGIKVMERDIREANGKDVLGAINTAGNMIYLAKGGKRNNVTLAEETAHAFVKNIVRQGEKGDPALWDLYQDIASTITETSLYREVLEEYEDVYTDEDTGEVDYAKIKEEAIAKAMAVAMAEKYDRGDSIMSSVASLLTNAIDRVRAFLEGSKISNGSEIILHQKLNKLVDQVMKDDVKQVKKQQRKDALNVVLEALGINTKDKHVKSEAEKRVEEKQKKIIMHSSARTIRFDYLNEATRQMLNKVGIAQEHWQFYPMDLQEQLLKCLSRA